MDWQLGPETKTLKKTHGLKYITVISNYMYVHRFNTFNCSADSRLLGVKFPILFEIEGS